MLTKLYKIKVSKYDLKKQNMNTNNKINRVVKTF